jgi:hypothetical protein
MAGCARVFAVELCYLRLCMQLCMLLPLVITLIVALPLYQVLEAVVAYLAIQYSLDLVLLLAFDESWGGGNAGRWPKMGSGCARDNLTTGKTGWRRQSWGGRMRRYAP